MPNIKDFETVISTANGEANQFSATDGGGVALKGTGARLKTFLTSSQKDSDKAMLRSFKTALEEAYGPEAAEAAWKKADLETRLQSGRPLSVRTATLAIQEAKTQVILAQDLRYKEQNARLDEDASKWKPNPQASKVEGAGLRLLQQDQGEVRIHNWNAKNNPDDKTRPALELDELVEKEVAAIKAERLLAERGGQKLEPMSERLMYLQAKLNLTERMVSEACKPENLKEGGPTANMFLGPDMFFSPSNGPKVEGFACEKTTGGACTEEEMRRITEGFRKISEKHPEVTLMPGTIVWSKPSDTIPVIDGLPRPADLAYNTAPVFSKGDLVHMTYKMTDGGDANYTAIGVNGPGGNSYTEPSSDNQFKARLQMFPENDPMMSQFDAQGQSQLRPLLDEMAKQSNPMSKGREWENGLRTGGADARSPHNTVFVVGGKAMALEICRDHTNGQARKEYAKMKTMDDPVSRLAKSQSGPGGGVNVHIMLSASNALTANGTICCSGGIAAQNDVSGGLSRSFHIESRIDQHNVKMTPGSRQQTFYYEHDAQKQKLAQDRPRVDGPGVGVGGQVPMGESVRSEPPRVTLPEGGGERPTLERHPSVSEVIQKGNTSSIKAKMGLDQPGPEENSVGSGKRSVRSEMGLDKPKEKVGVAPEKVSVAPKL